MAGPASWLLAGLARWFTKGFLLGNLVFLLLLGFKESWVLGWFLAGLPGRLLALARLYGGLL